MSEGADVRPTNANKKRQRNERNWKITVCKYKRNHGEEYTSRASNKIIPARTIGPPCTCKCFEKIGLRNIEHIFKSFWEIGDYNLQNLYLSELVSSVGIKRSIVKNRQSRTARRIHYTIIMDNIVHTVCSRAFYSIHGIKEKRVRTVLKNQTSSGLIMFDSRGKKEPASKINEERLSEVKEHINSLANHYNQSKGSHRIYLPSWLNVNALYTLYEDWMQETYPTSKKVSKSYYRKVFNEQFNIGFEPPKTDNL